MKEQERVLTVDDEPKILELVRSYLEINGFTALCAKNGREGMALFEQHPVSLILLDLMLPDVPGEEFCQKIRRTSDVPIIMLTAKADEESIIRGLSIGADDYVCKPFSPRQLMARVQAALRRNRAGQAAGSPAGNPGGAPAPRRLSYGGLSVDTEKRQVSRDGIPLVLTRDEYHILTLLMSRQAKIFTRDEILAAVKGDDYDGFDRSVDSHIKRLRAKIGDDPKTPRYIVTVYGMGYRFGAE
ncbi:MAG: response regulator transcription factor [Treponema sp.]|jgi:DNA-binding response OmpR family regulator|nr:response regulator transcription factor [Treponema sp.]